MTRVKLRAVRNPAGPDGAGFGEPYETSDGTTVLPVGHPTGVFVIREGRVTWEPAVDATRIALLAVGTGLVAATLGTLAVLRRPPWPDLSERNRR
jgi:hypothetical protein